MGLNFEPLSVSRCRAAPAMMATSGRELFSELEVMSVSSLHTLQESGVGA
uniref:Uncharacterized protein n=1 Tax=Physcomitrium patens TaxID=3218 RepID=A0A2K1KN86_PHYPA|nr:hypothetical protein PHYPA_006138 [Physcomitrium patens]